MDTPIIYLLKHPVYLGEQTISELKFKRPKIKHLKKLSNLKTLELSDISKLIEVLTELTPRIVDDIDVEDLDGISQVINSFFPDSQKKDNSGMLAES